MRERQRSGHAATYAAWTMPKYKDYYAVLGVPRTASPGRDQEGLPQARPPASPGRQARRHGRRAAVQGGQRGQRGPQRSRQAQAVRRARRELGGDQPGPRGRERGRRTPFAGFGGGGNVRYEFRDRATPASSPTSSVSSSAEERARAAGGGERPHRRGTRPTGGPRLRGHPGGDGPAAARPVPASAGPRTAAPASRRRRPTRPHAEISLDEAYHGTTRLVEVDGKRLEVTIPPGADTGTRIRLTGKGPAAATCSSSCPCCPTPGSRGAAPTSSATSPLTLEEALLGARGHGRDAQGQRPAEDPGRHADRADLPAHRPGHAALQADGHGDLYVKARVVLPTDLLRRGEGGRPAAPRPRRPTQPALTRTRPEQERPPMQLDRFTQKAQEAIVAAQATAQRLDSPILDAEHILVRPRRAR